MRILPKRIQTALELKADRYLFKNYFEKRLKVFEAVTNGWDTAVIAQQFCGMNFFLGIVIILAANQMYNDRKGAQQSETI